MQQLRITLVYSMRGDAMRKLSLSLSLSVSHSLPSVLRTSLSLSLPSVEMQIFSW